MNFNSQDRSDHARAHLKDAFPQLRKGSPMHHLDNPYSDQALAAARSNIEAAHSEVLSIVHECYERLCKRLGGCSYDAGTSEEVVLALAGRVIELSAMSLLCLRSGSVPAAKILTRSSLEAAYKICAICRDAKNIEQFVSDDHAARLHQYKDFHEYKKAKGGRHFAKGLEKKIDGLAAIRAQKIDPAVWATRAEMSDFHRLFYPWLCSDTHSNAAAIDHYFEPDRDYAIEIGPCDVDLPMTAMILSRCLVVVIRSLGSAEDAELNAWHSMIEERLGALEAR